MKRVVVLMILLIFLGCANKTDPELVGVLPKELENKLVYQDKHIPYYFPAFEEFGNLKDGTYVGELNGSIIDSGKVSVQIKEGKILNVHIMDMKVMAPTVRKEGRISEIFKGLPLQVINNQTARVDAVSAATGTSHVFKICVTRALWQASGKEDPMLEYSPY